MSGPQLSRRYMLGVTGALLGLAVAPPVMAQRRAGAMFLLDARLPEAAALRARADAFGHRSIDPQGEMIRLLTGEKASLVNGAATVIGLTTYTDLMLARDVLRGMGRPIRHHLALPDGRADDPLLALLHQSCTRNCGSRATSFLWLA
ncbi:hypothetical protein [Novosphingobium sp. KACC 22771]|uniref:hypothetical protein n=1 Tax=Novosphingobium sp. KACC 22771 TaxID=3025670 RepID=UPI0023663F6D|nr:hypothetical protein [Novosphingobium sp. KACC 22771]WDF75118.1 hypothetical protein PQ467_19055 [Novosphingobium sp. KACC 22771]